MEIKTKKKSPVYGIADVAIEIDENGKKTYWIQNAGWHAGQGGKEFTYGNCAVDTLEDALEILKTRLLRDQKDIEDHIVKKFGEA